jgi:hypothetical protein
MCRFRRGRIPPKAPGPVDPPSLPLIDGSPRIGCCVAPIGKVACVGLDYRLPTITQLMSLRTVT